MIDPASIVTKFLASITPKGWLVIGAAVLLASAVTAVVLIADNRDKRMIETASDAGAAEAVAEGHQTTLQQTGDANEAGNQVRDDRGNARYDECLRSVAETHRSFCERYRHQ